MAFTLTAPVPLIETTTVLPNPKFGDSEGTTGELNILRTVNGRRRTYVKSKGRRKLKWDFNLSRNKALELFEFYRAYNSQSIFVQDHNNRRWVGFIVNNPFEIEMSRRGAPTRQDWPVGEICQVTLEFEGTLTDVDVRNVKTFAPLALTEIDEMVQNVFVDLPLPTLGSIIHNWDANQIFQADNTILNVWPDSGPSGNDLIGTIGGGFDAIIDRSPTYQQASSILNSRPAVAFELIQGNLITQVAAMHTTSDTTFFPSKRGTVFWVMAHTIDPFNVATEFGVWSLQNSTLDDLVEQIHISGSSSPFMPVSARFRPVNVSNDIRLATVNTSNIPSGQPFIYTLSRDSGTNLRFRTNGIERTGAIILDNPGRTGLFHMNDQKFVPDFNSRMTGVWGQFLVYNKALSTTQIESVEKYLSLRWGIPLLTVPF